MSLQVSKLKYNERIKIKDKNKKMKIEYNKIIFKI